MPIIYSLVGILSLSLYVITIAGVFLLIMPVALVKLIVPGLRRPCNAVLDKLASGWITLNGWHQQLLTRTDIRVSGDIDQLSRSEWYMLIANHQSWVDIMILVRVLNGRIPYVKFFFKRELLWVPLLGQALWAMDFPVMRRRSKKDIVRNPALANDDLERTRRACEMYQHSPVTIINFLEGTRFTPAKQRSQASDDGAPEFRHLLKPKAGGLAFTLSAMNGQLRQMLDVTLYYPHGRPTFWEYACGRVRRVDMHIQQRPITDDMVGDYPNDEAFRVRFQARVNELWQEKDARLEAMAQNAADTH